MPAEVYAAMMVEHVHADVASIPSVIPVEDSAKDT